MRFDSSKAKVTVNELLLSHTIVEELEKLGHTPKKTSSDKLIYHCPFKDHNDGTPSFCVYLTSGDYQNFYCYGCSRGGNLIHFNKYLKGLSFKESLEKYGVNTENIRDRADNVISNIVNRLCQKLDERPALSIEDYVLRISRMCFQYMKRKGFSRQAVLPIDRIFEKVDEAYKRMDLHKIKETQRFLANELTRRD